MKYIPIFFLCSVLLGFLTPYMCPVIAQVPTTSKIVFTSRGDGRAGIYTMNPDGSQPVPLIRDVLAMNREPVWSPTGDQILFASNREGALDLYLMGTDEKNVRRVFEKVARRQNPTWAPDGKRIAYLDYGEWAIYTADIDGGEVKRLAMTGKGGGEPAWSPDGSEIAYVFAGNRNYQIRIINIETGAHRTLRHTEPFVRVTDPAWSPKGDKIAYASFPFLDAEADQGTIYVVNRDGSGVQQVVAKAGPRAAAPAWSPHGDEILYEQRVDGDKQIFKLHLSSGVPTQLTHKGYNFDADWFDSSALSVQPQPQLFVTGWGKLKQK